MCKKPAAQQILTTVSKSSGIFGKGAAAAVANQEQPKQSGGILRSKAEVAADEQSAQVATSGPTTATPVGVNVGQPATSSGSAASSSTRVKQGRGGSVGAGTLGRRRAASVGLGL